MFSGKALYQMSAEHDCSQVVYVINAIQQIVFLESLDHVVEGTLLIWRQIRAPRLLSVSRYLCIINYR